MRLIPTALLAAAAAGALALTVAAPAAAAQGLVVIDSGSGQLEVIQDPEPGVCHQGLTEVSTIANHTRGLIRLFPDANCRLRVFIVLPPSGIITGRYASFQAMS
ncbi:hypothetical protein [Nonomuraea bangladeshensis]|uniref:hypothetical protein n=1 Tax=Nonomuraea bangladeshensis TaxID=404385 RepID=UPI0031E2048C